MLKENEDDVINTNVEKFNFHKYAALW